MPIIDNSDSLELLGDIAFIAINGIIPELQNNYYCFNLHIDTPGTKTVVLRIHEDNEEPLAAPKEHEDVVPDSEGKDVKIKMEDSDDDNHKFMLNSRQVTAVPCAYLHSHLCNPNPDPKNPCAPWKSTAHKLTPETIERRRASTQIENIRSKTIKRRRASARIKNIDSENISKELKRCRQG
ncbi:hypothetical protein BDN67DRAFT_984565 [Paxillus ammoniavirescens]|nr:hypothetical protein BDN67DRAFT_984565 [Paxillus ammoniavirescens]